MGDTETQNEVVYLPSVDVCALCGDSECDGIACYASLDADDESDHPRIEQVQSWVRAGRAMEAAMRAWTEAEGREWRPW